MALKEDLPIEELRSVGPKHPHHTKSGTKPGRQQDSSSRTELNLVNGGGDQQRRDDLMPLLHGRTRHV